MITAAPVPIRWNPEMSIYASEPFLRSVGDRCGWLGGFDESGTMRCVLPYTVVRKTILRMVRFRVETMPVGKDLSIEDERGFLSSVMAYFRTAGADLVIPAATNTIFRTYPDGAAAAPYGTYVIDLTQPEDALWGNVSASHRRKVRLAMKDGVQIRSGPEELEMVFAMVRDTFGRSSLPFMGLESFKRFVLGLGDHVKVMIAEHRGIVQGCIVIPFSDHAAYYVYGGSIPEPQQGAMHLLHWEAIRHFRALGVRRYDFVGVRINPDKGSKQEGLMMFKQRFGGQLVEGYLWKYPLRPMKYHLYNLAARLRTGGDIVDSEQHKLKLR
jgi:hypothetical protein